MNKLCQFIGRAKYTIEKILLTDYAPPLAELGDQCEKGRKLLTDASTTLHNINDISLYLMLLCNDHWDSHQVPRKRSSPRHSDGQRENELDWLLLRFAFSTEHKEYKIGSVMCTHRWRKWKWPPVYEVWSQFYLKKLWMMKQSKFITIVDIWSNSSP